MCNFESFGLNPNIIKAIEKMGFEKPTPIQKEAIPYLLNNNTDILGQAQTGTGKTAAFGLPIIQKIDLKSNHIQALILSPTRELCIQIANDLQKFTKYTKGLHITPVYGGASIETQISSLKKKPKIVVGTPGRVLDLIKRKKLVISKINWLVLDEADEMLSMGFTDEVDSILDNTPKKKQTLLFSATIPSEIRRIIGTYMNEPYQIKVGKANKGAENVEHYYYLINARDRFETLKRIVDLTPEIYGIIFCRTRAETKEVAEKLIEQKYNTDALHGDMSQFMREQVMNRFRTKHLQLLVATDVAARGLDVSNLSHIINYNLPDELNVYIHRSGRTGRAGKKGISISISHQKEKYKIRALEKKVGKPITRLQIPSGDEICEKQLYHLISKITKAEIDDSKIEKYLPEIYEKLESIDKQTLIKKFVSIEFNYFLSKYKNAKNLNIVERKSKNNKRERSKNNESGHSKNKSRSRGVPLSKIKIEKGSKDNIKPGRILDIINHLLKKKNVEIGKIEIKRNYSIFEIDENYEQELKRKLKNFDFDKKMRFSPKKRR